MARHGGRILADQLALHGVKRVFSVPGESFLAALDGLYDAGIPNIVCRHEGGAAMMAEAYGKMTGQPGVLFVTRGPGATNAASGLHVARQDSTPMVAFVGQIARGHRDREAFQEVDYRRFFGPLVKWVAEVDQTDRLPEYIARAFAVATSGRPGPVVLALPEDMLSAVADAPDAPPVSALPPEASEAQLHAVLEALDRAERPLVVVGGPHWSARSAAELAGFAEAFDLPVAVSFRRQGYMDNRHGHYVGDLGVGMNPKLGQRLAQADLVLALGTRLGDTATNGYTLLDPAGPGPRIVHVHADADELGRVWRPDPGIALPAPAMVAALARLPGRPGPWGEWRTQARAEYEAWTTPRETPGAVKMEQVIAWLSAHLPEDAILTNGAGNYAAFLHRYFRYRGPGTQLAPTSGSMGYGFPAAVSASLEHPGRPVICLAGDGCFQMTLNEMSTAVQHGANVVVIVANNGRYGTIRMHQEKTYPGRVSGTDLANPDYPALARAYGGDGIVVADQADFPAAMEQALAAERPFVIELRLDGEALATGLTLSEARAMGGGG
ncbi:thiamine pyrophosphate-binding protein [Rhodovulum adriaticum]|uniref:Acetolactate synthase-1/2/3 large subunit n=1 Tax=Rhodovulum adriaticum TaxID=35804 RepID=A0A4R2NZ34_RHOAD|nr:thiamine pyrophosphate-binding protein [Rhodovulum adriaticum]MBK1634961.1 thiamine pyrophosphate-binding protein [Rhodovulum adriaticum]TCP27432.1 acetolactate synthase-1/2/3 large subunit [Rhodovulum adriaticum]